MICQESPRVMLAPDTSITKITIKIEVFISHEFSVSRLTINFDCPGVSILKCKITTDVDGVCRYWDVGGVPV